MVATAIQHTMQAPQRPRLTPELQAFFEALLFMDDHKKAPPTHGDVGRYTSWLTCLIESIDDGLDSYQQERTRFFKEDEHVRTLFAAYVTPKAKSEKGKQKRYSEPEPRSIDTAKVLEYHEENEYGDALLFASVFEGQICYDHSAKKWFLWAGHYWQKDATGQIRILVSGKLGSVYLKAAADLNTPLVTLQEEIARLQRDSLADNDKELAPLQDKYKQVKTNMNQLSKRAKELRGAKRMQSVLTFIQSLMGVTSNQWDANPWVLGTSTGVIDLRTGTLKDGDPEDYIRTIISTEWTGINTQCPRFERFLQEIFDDNQDKNTIIQFLQKLFGYGITGITNDAIFPILYGEEGRNGKDTLLGILKEVLGPITGAISNDVFVSNDKFKASGAASPHICDLQGKRLVWGSETKQGDKLNTAQIKLLTGGGDVSTRQLYGEQFSFTPTHKLLLMTNYKPHADANDKAFWTRACLINFGLRFVSDPKAENERKADTHLKEMVRQEAPGVLAWLVRGCLDWQHEGLNIPQSIQIATGEYRNEEDSILQFVKDRCEKCPGAKTKATPLYEAYKLWSKDQTNFTMNKKLFSSAMEKTVEKKRSNNAIEYIGIRLIPHDEDDTLFAEEEKPSKERAK